MNKKLIILIGSLFFVKINVLAMTTDSVLQLIQTLPIIQSDAGSEFHKWESTYDYLKKLEFNEDARKIINAIAQKYGTSSLPKSGKEIINSVVKKGADDLCKKVGPHEFMLKNRKIRTLSTFIVNLNGINAIIEISNLGLDDGLKDYIASLVFDEDSRETILSVVVLFGAYKTFPLKISEAIVAFMQKAAQFLTKDVPGAGDSIGVKQLYNNKVDEFVQFVTTLNEKKQNLIHIKLPSKVIIPAAWESSTVLKNVKNALTYIKDSVVKIEGKDSVMKIKDLTVGELDVAKTNIKGHLNTLNGNIGSKGAITIYLNSEVGKTDDKFIGILMNLKEILEKWYEEGDGKSTPYHKLWEYLNSYKPEIVPPMPPRPVVDDPSKPLKDKLVLLKTNLSQLRVKLQLLSTKLVQIKSHMEPLGVFVNTDEWWDKAIANSGKMTEAHKTQILKEFEKIKKEKVNTWPGQTNTVIEVYADKQLLKKNFQKGAKAVAIKFLNLKKLDKLSDKIFIDGSDDEKIFTWLLG